MSTSQHTESSPVLSDGPVPSSQTASPSRVVKKRKLSDASEPSPSPRNTVTITITLPDLPPSGSSSDGTSLACAHDSADPTKYDFSPYWRVNFVFEDPSMGDPRYFDIPESVLGARARDFIDKHVLGLNSDSIGTTDAESNAMELLFMHRGGPATPDAIKLVQDMYPDWKPVQNAVFYEFEIIAEFETPHYYTNMGTYTYR